MLLRYKKWPLLLTCLIVVVPAWLQADQAGSTGATGTLRIGLDTVWVLVAGFLVFFMNLGFAMVEAGLARAKNTVNILAKNFIVFAVASVGFYIIGWGLMFGNGTGLFGLEGLLGVSGPDTSPATGDAYQGAYQALSWAGVPLWAKFFFSSRSPGQQLP